jgi:hypothetical protein
MPPKDKAKSAAKSEGGAVITITDGDRKYKLASDELGPADDLASRQATGYPVGHFLETFSSDSMVVVIWMARRKTGEPNLAFQSVMADYPTYAAFKDLKADYVTPDDEDAPEVEADPLPDEAS